MIQAKNIAIFGINRILRAFLRLSLLVWVVLALTLFVVLGAATHSQYLFLLGVSGFAALPFVLGAIAIILLPFR